MVVIFLFAGCSPAADTSMESSGIRFDLDKEDEERLLLFYLGSYVDSPVMDPVGTGLLEKREKTWYLLDPSQLQGVDSLVIELYSESILTGTISWSSFESFISRTYYEAREAPHSVAEIRESVGDWADSEAWFSVELSGSMTSYRRKIFVPKSNLQAAVQRLQSASDEILYDVGTLFIGEHYDQGLKVETTAMVKRSDGFWDYFAYDGSGNLTSELYKEPDNMIVPIQCTGCHFGDRLFEPERSFPALARPGPNGAREVYVEESWKNPNIVSELREHGRRSDTILGLYATLYLSNLKARGFEHDLSPEEDAVLLRLGFSDEAQ